METGVRRQTENRGAQQKPPTSPELGLLFEKETIIRNEIGEIHGKINEERKVLREIHDQSHTSRERWSNVDHLKELNAKITSHTERRGFLNQELGAAKSTIERLRGGSATKGKIKTTKDMESRVKEVESAIEKGGVSATEEKRLLAEVSKLKKERKAVEGQEKQQQEQLKSQEKLKAEMSEELSKLAPKIREMIDEKKKIKRVLEDLDSKRDMEKKLREDREKVIQEYEDAKKALDEKKETVKAEIAAQKEKEREEREKKRQEFEKIKRKKDLQRDIFKLEEKFERLSVDEVGNRIQRVFAAVDYLKEAKTNKEFKKGLSFPLWVISTIAEMKVAVPCNKGQIDATIQGLEKKVETVRQEQEQADLKRKDKRERLSQELEKLRACVREIEVEVEV
ncbi:MAG: uncharacterized protein A8A55_2146 [Amphiamblys sp. WSBS2006]|nr:MAG: uncharacterized protein A8A55_2146 [Amphiamblys sp. WSBS2006]